MQHKTTKHKYMMHVIDRTYIMMYATKKIGKYIDDRKHPNHNTVPFYMFLTILLLFRPVSHNNQQHSTPVLSFVYHMSQITHFS